MATTYNDIQTKAQAMFGQISAWRQHFHKWPELSFQEVETSRFIAEALEKIPGMHVESGVGYPTAILGTISSGSGPVIAIRADMDALPIQEANACHYRSEHEGVMHACGHDAHSAIGLGVASLIGNLFQNGELEGTVKFLFQPAEEKADEHGSTGAPYMIRKGVLNDVDRVLALHMSPEDQVGSVKVHDGYSMANVDVFEATVRGSGGHGAYPHLGEDPIWMLGPVLQALHGIVARRVSPLDSAVVSVGSIQSGSAGNVIPSEVHVKGTMRSYHPDVRELLHKELDKAFSLVRSLDGDYQLAIKPEDPALYNDQDVNRMIRETFKDLYPDFELLDRPFGLGGEDFAHMTQIVPGAMFFLGCAVGDEQSRDLHTPHFDIDENVLPIGVSILAENVRRFLAEKK
ncbi:M20 family metallopeptidase [Lentibacillus sp. CBA3610]|uniref:M20 metallopeptidase family protein n=1 Tax=Lentibacillus sp. CBA3610 TaxID=2518176 RepID=UPI0015985858|nr:M20 family metallopeptidase [Lentibacillus sp. CBA3610]QKY70032.1 amidohydrolase [Lentibacillus sp. CBA3610]